MVGLICICLNSCVWLSQSCESDILAGHRNRMHLMCPVPRSRLDLSGQGLYYLAWPMTNTVTYYRNNKLWVTGPWNEHEYNRFWGDTFHGWPINASDFLYKHCRLDLLFFYDNLVVKNDLYTFLQQVFFKLCFCLNDFKKIIRLILAAASINGLSLDFFFIMCFLSHYLTWIGVAPQGCGGFS